MVTPTALQKAPRDRRFLCRTKVWMWGRNQWEHVGYRWVEAWFRPSTQTFEIWQGAKRYSTTERLDPVQWSELPIED